MSETDTAANDGTVDPGLPPAPGAEHYRALDLANSAIALSGGQFLDSLGTPFGDGLPLHPLQPLPAARRASPLVLGALRRPRPCCRTCARRTPSTAD